MKNSKHTFMPFVVLILIGCDTQTANKESQRSNNIPELKLYSCDNDSLLISPTAKTALMNVGMTQCMMPFGVLIAADQNMPSSYVKMSGKILAEMLDQNIDSKMDDSTLFPYVSDWRTGWLAMPVNQETWETEQLPILYQDLGYDIIIPSWWMGLLSSNPTDLSIAVMVEEITHFLTQFGYSPRYPEKFGVENWQSIIAQETFNARCDWWQHPENDCPNSPAEYDGDCSGPSCDVVEFYHQVLILRAGMQPGWYGINFPQTSSELEELLSQQMKDLMDNPAYHQLNKPLTFDYPIKE